MIPSIALKAGLAANAVTSPPPTAAPKLHGRSRYQSRYAGLAESLRTRVLRGEWLPGMALPPEQALTSEYGVALGTMRQALQLLVQDGVIERIHGKGTFVRQALSGAPMMRFFRFGQADGQVPTSAIVQRQVRMAPDHVALGLALPPAAPVLRLERLRLLDNKPCLLEHIWLPLPQFDALLQHDTDTWGDLLYPAFSRLCGVQVHRANDVIRFGQLAAPQATALGLPPGHPCAVVDRVAHDLAGQCIEVRRSVGDAHAFEYSVQIQ